MEHSGLQSEAFHKDMEDAIRNINEKFHLNIRCGMVTLGDHSLVIQVDTDIEE